MLIDSAAGIVLLVGVPILVLAVPITSLVLASREICARRLRSALGFILVPAVGAVLFYVSGFATGLFTVWSCVGPIQSAVQTVKSGGHLPRESQRYPISVLHVNPDVAVEDLDSFMDSPSFITYDTADETAAAVAVRVRKYEVPACLSGDVRRIWGDYYWVGFVC